MLLQSAVCEDSHMYPVPYFLEGNESLWIDRRHDCCLVFLPFLLQSLHYDICLVPIVQLSIQEEKREAMTHIETIL